MSEERTEEKKKNPDEMGEGLVVIQEPDLINYDSSLTEVVTEDLDHANNVIRGLYFAWGKVKTISGVCKLATTTMDVIERRRKLILKPANFTEYKESQSKEKDFGFETLK